MTKTSTSKTSANLPLQNMFQSSTDNESDAEINLFYDQIKNKLDSLMKSPSDDIINNILAYSKTK
ncbi:hypothetical protein [Pedobacter rhizosphaerae]|uniref:Uncharacterized protein n=1 Tax=Pedobacter rhizosphaerae TaxID=390241 RepID=A0A1H9NNF5_9SPHI|nr:hypothetical protein [Pedobacter rhizosphaerae]SER36903.1 hypothetical protein SAMN04488023_10811 [Pedobacter rhizosphaerae]